MRNVMRCSKCGQEKGQEKFNRNAAHPNGFSNWCQECTAEYNREYRRKGTHAPERERLRHEAEALAREIREGC